MEETDGSLARGETGNAVSDGDVVAKMEGLLREMLAEARQYAPANAVERKEPERWLEAARQLVQGVSGKKVKEGACKGHKGLYDRIKAQLAESPSVGDLKRELALRNLEAVQTTAELRRTMGEKFREKMEEPGVLDSMAPLDAAKFWKELALANKMDTETLMKMRGENVQRIQVSKEGYDEGEYDRLLEELRAVKEKRAESVDVSDSEGGSER